MTARTVLRTDAALDTAVALLCLAGAAGVLGGAPAWLGPPVLVVLAVVLAALAAGLLRLARRPVAVVLLALGAGNAGSALACAAWGVLGDPAHLPLRAAAGAVAVALAAVAAAQLAAGRRLRAAQAVV
jgi:hypothetical protein